MTNVKLWHAPAPAHTRTQKAAVRTPLVKLDEGSVGINGAYSPFSEDLDIFPLKEKSSLLKEN